VNPVGPIAPDAPSQAPIFDRTVFGLAFRVPLRYLRRSIRTARLCGSKDDALPPAGVGRLFINSLSYIRVNIRPMEVRHRNKQPSEFASQNYCT